MDDEIRKKMIEWLQNIETFSLTEMPYIFQQIINSTIFEYSIIWFISFIVMTGFVITYLLCKKEYDRKALKPLDFYDDSYVTKMSLLLSGSIIAFMTSVYAVTMLCKCFFFQKAFLIDYFLK